MKIALVDDEEYQLEALKDALLLSLFDMGLRSDGVDTFSSAADFFTDFWKGKYDIIILDIYMGELNGIDIARRIRRLDPDVALAFCTSSNEFAAETYEVEAKYYLNKPISKEKVAAMLSRFNFASIERNRSVKLPDGFSVPLRHILYSEYNNHSVTFHIMNIPPRSFYMAQSEAEDMLLTHKGFCVVNKGCIVNFEQVERVVASAFLMKNGETVQIPRRRFKEIEAAYTRYIFEKMMKEVSD